MSEPPHPSSGTVPEQVSGTLPARIRLRPAPAPLEADTFTIVLAGTVLWAVAFLVLLPFRDGHGVWLQTCAAGFGLGLLGVFLTRHRRRRHRPSPDRPRREGVPDGP